jgi:hypothetical protein
LVFSSSSKTLFNLMFMGRAGKSKQNVDKWLPRDAWRRVASVLSYGVPRLVFSTPIVPMFGVDFPALCRVASRSSSSIYSESCRCRDDRRRDARWQVAGVVSYNIPTLVFAFLDSWQ